MLVKDKTLLIIYYLIILKLSFATMIVADGV